MEKVKKDDAIIVRLEGRAFPVEIAYLKETTADVVQSAVEVIFDIHLKVRLSLSTVSRISYTEYRNLTATARRHLGFLDGKRRDRSMYAGNCR